MTKEISKTLALLKYSNSIVVFGSGITWTGLSYILAEKYSDPRYMVFMQAIAMISGFFGPFFAFWINSKSSFKSILIFSEFIAAICSALILSILIGTENITLPILILLSTIVSAIFLTGAVSGLFIEPLYANLVEKKEGSTNDIGKEFASYACYAIISKLAGMSTGPILFNLLGQYSLLITTSTFICSTIFIKIAMKHITDETPISSNQNNEFTILKGSAWKRLLELPLIESSIANSMTYIVVLATSTRAMVLHASATEMSLFWFGATGCALLANFIISKIKNASSLFFQLENRFGFLQSIPIFIALVTTDIFILLIFQFIYSFLNPFVTNQSRSNFYTSYGKNSQNTLEAYTMRTTASNAIILVFTLLVYFYTESIPIISTFIIALVLFRWYIAFKSRTQLDCKETSI